MPINEEDILQDEYRKMRSNQSNTVQFKIVPRESPKEKPKESLMAAAIGALYFALTLFLFTVAVSGACISLARLRNKYWFPEHQSMSELGRYRNAAVSTDAVPCAAIGKDILAKKGSAVDAAIAVLLCLGVINPQSSGIGGGFLMLYYNRAEETAYYIDSREVAPEEATEDMFYGNASLARMGGLSIAVPGEVAGYQHIHDRFGSLPWKQLFLPTIKMCREGIKVNAHLAKALDTKKPFIMQHKSIRNVFTNKETNEIYKRGEKYTRNDLAATLEAIAEEKSAAFYGPSETATDLLKDLKAAGSIITESDMQKYSPRDREPIRKIFKNNMTLYSASPPGSGALLAFILGVLDRYEDFNADVWRKRRDTVKTLHRIIELFKFAYGRRMELEDSDSEHVKKLLELLTSEEYADRIRKLIDDEGPHNNPNHYGVNVTLLEDHGTAHVSIIAPNGDAVSVTSTVAAYFGSMVLSPSTGIILNNNMDNFSSSNITNSFGIPPSGKNRIKPGRRPFSSMSPVIVIDSNGDVKLTLGGSGGPKITTCMAQTLIRTLWLNEDIKKAIDAPRFHHQLLPNVIKYEKLFPEDLLDDLKEKGHQLKFSSDSGIIIGILKDKGILCANSDFRKGGEVDGF